jgi:hypothetical protein
MSTKARTSGRATGTFLRHPLPAGLGRGYRGPAGHSGRSHARLLRIAAKRSPSAAGPDPVATKFNGWRLDLFWTNMAIWEGQGDLRGPG